MTKPIAGIEPASGFFRCQPGTGVCSVRPRVPWWDEGIKHEWLPPILPPLRFPPLRQNRHPHSPPLAVADAIFDPFIPP